MRSMHYDKKTSCRIIKFLFSYKKIKIRNDILKLNYNKIMFMHFVFYFFIISIISFHILQL